MNKYTSQCNDARLKSAIVAKCACILFKNSTSTSVIKKEVNYNWSKLNCSLPFYHQL